MTFFDPSKIPDQLTYINGLGTLHESGLKGLVSLLRKEVTSRQASILVIDGIVSARRVAPTSKRSTNSFMNCRPSPSQLHARCSFSPALRPTSSNPNTRWWTASSSSRTS